VHPWYADAPQLAVDELPPVAEVNTALTGLCGPSSSGAGASFYIFCARVLVEVDLQTADVRRFEVPFDSHCDRLYAYGACSALLAEDGRIYFGMAARPTRLGRFDPRTGEVKLLGETDGWSPNMWASDRRGNLYVVTYPAVLTRVDVRTGGVETLGRMTPDGLYCHQSGMAAGDDGLLYVSVGPRDFRLMVFDPARNQIDQIGTGWYQVFANRGRPYAALKKDPRPGSPSGPSLVRLTNGRAEPVDQPPEPGPWPEDPSTQAAEPFEIEWRKQGPSVQVQFRRKGEAERRCVTFAAPVRWFPQDSILDAPDGRLLVWGGYQTAEYDAAADRVRHLPEVRMSAYDGVLIGQTLYLGGYPSARFKAWDFSRPVRGDGEGREADENPRMLAAFGQFVKDGRLLGVHRIWQVARGADGLLYLASTATRWHRGGALLWWDPASGAHDALREPFDLIGPRALWPIEDGRGMLVATWTSPDPRRPGAEPESAPLLFFDCASKSIVDQWTPAPGLKVFCGLYGYAPGEVLALAKPAVQPSYEADDTYYGREALLFLDVDHRKVLRRVDLPFSASRRVGRPVQPAADGSLWMSGGGGLLRIDTQALTVEPLARVGGADGDFRILGDRLVMVGERGLRRMDVSGLVRPADAPRE